MTDDDPYYFEVGTTEVLIDDDVWLPVNNVRHAIESTFKHPELTTDLGWSIRLTNDTGIQQLNRDFRQKDKPTNVLSFPHDDPEYLGDIAISYETIKREAEEQGKDFIHHFTHMLIHGFLHLNGYDHETDAEAEEMESLEIKILADMGIENPYI